MTENHIERVKGVGATLSVLVVLWVFAALSSAYMVFLRAPSVVSVRPELETADAWTAIFSGRFESWLFYHYPTAATAFTFVLVTIAGIAMVKM